MLDDTFITLLKARIEEDSFPVSGNLAYLLKRWDEVKREQDVALSVFDGKSYIILSGYIQSASEGEWYDYRLDPWYGYSAPIGTEREENTLKLRLLDGEDMAHDLSLLADDIMESFGFTFTSLSSAESMSTLLKVIASSSILSPSLFNRDNLVSFIRKLGELELLSVAVKRARARILISYSDDVLQIEKVFWKGEIPSYSAIYRETVKRIEKARKDGKRINASDISSLSALVASYRKLRHDYSKKEKEISPSFPLYSGLSTDWKSVSEEASSLLENITSRDYGILPFMEKEEWEEARKKAYIFYAGLNTIYTKYNTSVEALLAGWDENAARLKSLPLSSLEKRFHDAGESDGLRYRWKNVHPIVEEARKNGIITFLDDALSSHLSSSSLLCAFNKALVKKAVSALYESDEDLKRLMSGKKETEKERAEDYFALYVLHDLRSDASSFGVDSFSSPSYGEFISFVVERDAPVFERDLMKGLSFLSGEEYLTPEAAKGYRTAMEGLEGTAFVRRGGFLYSLAERKYPFRKASFMRDFSHIAPEEIQSAFVSILEKRGKMEKTELYNTLGSYCGYSVVLKSRYAFLDRILLSTEGITVNGENVEMGERK